MTFNVSEFRSAIGTGTRPNLFQITISGGLNATSTDEISVLAKASSLPASTVGMIEVPHVGGRRLKIAGDRSFAEWTVTLMSDEAFSVRKRIEAYQQTFVNMSFDELTVGNRANAALATVTVKQLSDTGSTLRTYALQNAFVTDISAIDVSYDTRDAIEEFTVTWVYDFFTIA